MLEGIKAEEIVKEIVRDWEMESIDVDGHSRGIVIAWSPVLHQIAIIKHD